MFFFIFFFLLFRTALSFLFFCVYYSFELSEVFSENNVCAIFLIVLNAVCPFLQKHLTILCLDTCVLILVSCFYQRRGHFSVNDISRMFAPRLQFHKSVFAVGFVQIKSAVNQCERGNYANTDANPLIYSNHIHHHKHDKHPKQPACKDEKILRLQTLKLRRFTNALVNAVFHFLNLELRMMNEEFYKLHKLFLIILNSSFYIHHL